MEHSTTGIRVLASPEEIRQLLRAKVAAAVQELLEEEISLLLGSERYERTETRNGYRNGGERRQVTTEAGPMELKIPRARVRQADGSTAEFRSAVLPRYQRRTKRVDEAILGAYLAGANTRRIRKALEPLLGESNLSRSAISRVVQRIKASFEIWSNRDLSENHCMVLYLDGIHLNVRLARRVVSVPVLIALGVREDGRKELISMRLVGAEIVYAKNGMVAREAREKFLRKWRSLCPEVARSLEEAGDHLLTFFEFPRAMWKSLRTTNPIENLNREFRRRTKTQGSFSTEDSALTLLWGLIAFGQIRMRKIDGHEHVQMLLEPAKPKAA